MSNSVKETVQENLAPIVEQMGFVLVEVEYVKRPNGMNLNLFIDGENGVDLDALEKIHRTVDVKLDELDPTNGAPYTLNCSSLGLDRPLTTEYQFLKAKGTEVEIKLYEPLKPFNKKVLVGILLSWDNTSITFEIEKNNITLQKNQVAQLVPVIKF